MPLHEVMHMHDYININGHIGGQDYVKYLDDRTLTEMAVEFTNYINRPCIYDLLNKEPQNRVHNLFVTVAENIPGTDILD